MKHAMLASKSAKANRGKDPHAPGLQRTSTITALHHILQLQRTIGNRAVQRLIQATLQVNHPADPHEQEADQIAPTRDDNGVASDAAVAVQRASGDASQPLPGNLQERFEGSLGADLGGVRVHTGAASAVAAQAVGARAYTVGQDIHFNAGEYSPSSPEGQYLLAHEVAHTIQQGTAGSTAQSKIEVSTPQDAAEIEADHAATAMIASRPVSISFGTGVARVIMREPKKDTVANASTIQGIIANAASRGERDKLRKIGAALDATTGPQNGAGTGQGIVTIDGQQFLLDGGDVDILRGVVIDTMNQLDEPAPAAQQKSAAAAAPPAPKAPAPAKAPASQDAVKPSASSDASWVHELIAIAAKAGSGARLKEIRALLQGGQSVLTFGDQSATAADVQIEGKDLKLTAPDIQALLGECDAALKFTSIDGKLPEGSTGSMLIILSLPGGKVFASSDKFMEGDFVLKTTAPTTVTLRVSQTELSISFNPPIKLDANFLFSGNVSVEGLDFNFARASLSMRSRRDYTGIADPTDELFAKLQAKVLAAFAGTPLAEKGYDPLKDGDLAGTLAKVKANLAAMPDEAVPAPQDSKAGAGGAEGEAARNEQKAAEEARKKKEQEEAADPARVHAEDVTLGSINVSLTMKEPKRLSAGDGAVIIPANTTFHLSAMTTGQPGQPGAGGPVEFSRVSLSSTPEIMLLASGQPAARLNHLTVNRGGSVTIAEDDVSFEGTVGSAAAIEVVGRIIWLFSLFARGEGFERLMVAENAELPKEQQTVTAAVGRAVLQAIIGRAIRDLILDNRKALGDDLDLADAMGIK